MLRYTVGLVAATGVGAATFHFASAAADTLVQGAVLKLDESRAHFGIVSHDVVSLESPETWASSMEMDSVTPYGFFSSPGDKFQQQFQLAEQAPQAKALHVLDLGYAVEMQLEAPEALVDILTRDFEASGGARQTPPSPKQTVKLTQSPAGNRNHKRSNSSDSSSATVLTEHTKRVPMDNDASNVDEKGLISTVGLFLGTFESFKASSCLHEKQALYNTLLDLCVPGVGFSDRSFGQSSRRNSGSGVEQMLDSMSSMGNIPPLDRLEEVLLEDGTVYVHYLRDKQPSGSKVTAGRLLIFQLNDANRISSVMSCSA